MIERLDSGRFKSIKAFCPPVTNRRSKAKTRANQASSFQPFERRMDSACRNVAPQTLLDFAKYRAPICLFLQPHDREKNSLFK